MRDLMTWVQLSLGLSVWLVNFGVIALLLPRALRSIAISLAWMTALFSRSKERRVSARWLLDYEATRPAKSRRLRRRRM